MPKRNTEEYEDDDGFVEDAPRSKSKSSSKKQKTSKSSARISEDTDNGPVPGGGHMSNDGEYWEVQPSPSPSTDAV